MKRMNKEQGFTLIELIVVIVILGILAATALPKFVDVSSDAKTAAVQGAAGALSSSASINYAAHLANAANGISLGASAGAALAALMPGWDSTKFVIASDATCGTASTNGAGVALKATLSYSGGTASVNSALATIICTG